VVVVALEVLAYFLDNIVAVWAAIVVAAAVVDGFDIVVAVAVETYHY
jgi:hypothetical protein